MTLKGKTYLKLSPLICTFTFTFPLSPSALHLCVSPFTSPFHLSFTLCLSCLPFTFHLLPFPLPGLFESPKALPNAFPKSFPKPLLPEAAPQVLFLGFSQAFSKSCSTSPKGCPKKFSNPSSDGFSKGSRLLQKLLHFPGLFQRSKAFPRLLQSLSNGRSRG